MASVVQHGRRRGSSKRGSSAEEGSSMIQPPDLRQVTVLSKSEWLRIQDQLNQDNKDKERIREAAEQKEALRLQSQEAVKLWSNSIACQRQKKLEAKKIREEMEEEKKKLADKEETEYQEQQRKEAIEKARSQLFYQTDRVKGLHGALLLTEVLKEREAQIELKQRIKKALKAVDNEFLVMAETREAEASRQEQEKALQKKLGRQAAAEELKKQVKESELARERQKMEIKKDGEETQRRQELHQWEQRMEDERQAKLKRDLMHTHMEHATNKGLMKAADAQKQEAEEEQRKLFLSAKQKMLKLRVDKEKELFREAQMIREKIKLAITQEDPSIEEQRIAKAVAEQEANKEQRQREEEEKKAEMLESIAAHRELMRQEKEQRDKSTTQSNRDTLQAKKEADRIFSKTQQAKARRMKDDGRKLQDFNEAQMADQRARRQQLRREAHEFVVKSAELVAEEETQFLQYSQSVIRAAAETQRNVFPLCKAAAEGVGPVNGAVRNSYLVQDLTGAQMPKYVSGATQSIKKLNEAEDIQNAKRRLGFIWS